MASSYTNLLKFDKPGLGDTGWGTSVNGGFTDMAEQALTGYVQKAVTVAGPNTIPTIANGTSSDGRNQFIELTASPALTSPATLTVPAGTLVGSAGNNKLYFIKNSAGGDVTVETSGGTTVVVPNGKAMMLRVTSTGVEEAMTHAVTLSIGTLTLTNALGATSGGTGQTGYAVGDLLYASSTTALGKLTVGATNAVLTVAAGIPAWVATLPVVSGGTGLSSPGALGNVLRSDGAGAWTSSALASATDTAEGLVELATTAEVQTGTDTTRAITPATLRGGALVRGTAQNTTSGTYIDFTGIPSWAKRVTVLFSEVSTNGTSTVIVQLGTSSGVTISGYLSAAQQPAAGSTSTAGFVIDANSIATMHRCGAIVIVNMTGNLWVSSGDIAQRPGTPSTEVSSSGGRVTLSGALDRIRITTSNGTDAFDGGSVNIMYE